MSARKPTVKMSRRILLFAFVGTITLVGCCQDWDPAACALLAQSHKDLCADPTFANNTCVRFCGNCPLDCYSCPRSVLSPDDCNTTLTCQLGEVCMTRELLAKDGHKEFIMTCEQKSNCDGSLFGFGTQALLGKRRIIFEDEGESDIDIHGRQDRSVAIDCCDTDFCNMPVTTTTKWIKTTTSTTTTTKAMPTPPPTTQLTPMPPSRATPTPTQYTNGHIPTTAPHYYCRRDVAFLLDSSGSLGQSNFNAALGFVHDLIDGLPIGPTGTLTSLMTFSSSVHIEWYLNQLTTIQATMKVLSSVRYRAGGTHTDLALSNARTQIFTSEHGDRAGVENVVIVLTDGLSNNPDETIKQANNLHTVSHDVISILVGHATDMSELQAIATDRNHVFNVHSFPLLSTLKSMVRNLMCGG